jgi:hypothetical protein
LLAIVAIPPLLGVAVLSPRKKLIGRNRVRLRLRSCRKILKLRMIFIATDDCRAHRTQRIINLKN